MSLMVHLYALVRTEALLEKILVGFAVNLWSHRLCPACLIALHMPLYYFTINAGHLCPISAYFNLTHLKPTYLFLFVFS